MLLHVCVDAMFWLEMANSVLTRHQLATIVDLNTTTSVHTKVGGAQTVILRVKASTITRLIEF